MKGKWRVVIGLALSAAAIAFILRSTDVGLIWQNILRADPLLLVLAAAVATLSFPIRAMRWKVILKQVDPDLPLGLLWRATAVGFALNNSLPGRVGEVARAYALSREAPKVGFAAAFASLAVDRVFDAIVLVAFLLIGLLTIPAATDLDARALIYASVITVASAVAMLLAALFALAFFPSRIIRLYQLFARRLTPSLEVRGSALLASFASGLSALSHPGRFLLVLAWSIVHWLTGALAFWTGFMALGLQMNNSFMAAITTQSVIAFSIAVPNAPGGLGVFQYSGSLALGLYGISPEDANAWGFAFWVFSFIPITVIGITYFVRMGLTFREIRDVVSNIGGGAARSDAPSPSPPSPSPPPPPPPPPPSPPAPVTNV